MRIYCRGARLAPANRHLELLPLQWSPFRWGPFPALKQPLIAGGPTGPSLTAVGATPTLPPETPAIRDIAGVKVPIT